MHYDQLSETFGGLTCACQPECRCSSLIDCPDHEANGAKWTEYCPTCEHMGFTGTLPNPNWDEVGAELRSEAAAKARRKAKAQERVVAGAVIAAGVVFFLLMVFIRSLHDEISSLEDELCEAQGGEVIPANDIHGKLCV